MKKASWLFLVALASVTDAAPRNPFLPPVSLCETLLNKLDGWRLGGVVISPHGAIALLNNGNKRWRRVAQGTQLEPGAMLVSVSLDHISARLGKPCPGASYHWKRQGELYGMGAITDLSGTGTAGLSGK